MKLLFRLLAFASAASAEELKLMTWNVGLLRVGTSSVLKKIASCMNKDFLFENPPHADARIGKIAGAIASSDADVVAIQEIYEEQHWETVRKAAEKAGFKHSSRLDPEPDVSQLGAWGRVCCKCVPRGIGNLLFGFWKKNVAVHNALALVSRFEIKEQKLETFNNDDVSLDEALGANKAFQWVVVDSGEDKFGDVMLVNMHLTAGGSTPDSEDAINARRRELEIVKAKIEEGRVQGVSAFIIGDVNAAPEESKQNYTEMIDGAQDCVADSAGFLEYGKDAKAQAKERMPEGAARTKLDQPKERFLTWDPENSLNDGGVHDHCAAQRCDHIVYFGHGKGEKVKVEDAEMLFTETDVGLEIIKGEAKKVTKSDHYALYSRVVKPDSIPLGKWVKKAVTEASSGTSNLTLGQRLANLRGGAQQNKGQPQQQDEDSDDDYDMLELSDDNINSSPLPDSPQETSRDERAKARKRVEEVSGKKAKKNGGGKTRKGKKIPVCKHGCSPCSICS